MNSKQKIIIIIIIVILIITSSLAIFLSFNINNNNPSNDLSQNQNEIPEEKISKEIKLLTNEEWFFGVQDVINNYYTRLESGDNLNVFNLLESKFREDNNLTASNAATELNRFNYTPTFIAEKIYYNPNSSITYFFAQGYTVDTPMDDGDIKYYEKINFLVIRDSNNKYVLIPLDDNIDIETYAETYNIEKVYIDNNTSFKTSSLSPRNKTTYYISIFQDLLYLDPKKAYNLLDEETQEIFTDYSTNNGYNESLFLEYRDTISIYLTRLYDNIETINEDDKKIYKRMDNDSNTITITENNVMDFKIGFNFINNY